MRHHYLEVKRDDKVLKRVKTSYSNFDTEWEELAEAYPEYEVSYTISSEKERVFDNLQNVTA